MKNRKGLLACPNCHSTHIVRDALAGWDIENQSFTSVVAVLDNGSCQTCGLDNIGYFAEADISDLSSYEIHMLTVSDCFAQAPEWAQFLVKESNGDWLYVSYIPFPIDDHKDLLEGSLSRWQDAFPSSRFELANVSHSKPCSWQKSLVCKPEYQIPHK